MILDKMIISFQKSNSTFFVNVVLLFFMALCLTSCEKDNPESSNKIDIESEEYTAPTADALRIVSDKPAYVIPFSYNNFGKALVDRLQNRVQQ